MHHLFGNIFHSRVYMEKRDLCKKWAVNERHQRNVYNQTDMHANILSTSQYQLKLCIEMRNIFL